MPSAGLRRPRIPSFKPTMSNSRARATGPPEFRVPPAVPRDHRLQRAAIRSQAPGRRLARRLGGANYSDHRNGPQRPPGAQPRCDLSETPTAPAMPAPSARVYIGPRLGAVQPGFRGPCGNFWKFRSAPTRARSAGNILVFQIVTCNRGASARRPGQIRPRAWSSAAISGGISSAPDGSASRSGGASSGAR